MLNNVFKQKRNSMNEADRRRESQINKIKQDAFQNRITRTANSSPTQNIQFNSNNVNTHAQSNSGADVFPANGGKNFLGPRPVSGGLVGHLSSKTTKNSPSQISKVLARPRTSNKPEHPY